MLPRAGRQLEAHVPQAAVAFAAGCHDPRATSSWDHDLRACVRVLVCVLSVCVNAWVRGGTRVHVWVGG